MGTTYTSKLQDFGTISLTELNATASYLKRMDKKFLLNYKQFSKVLDELMEDFYVLEINGKKIFSYDNIYMDTPDYLFYNQHQDKKKSRTKVRTRYYIDSNLAFFEYKQKIKGITSKYRYEFPSEEHGFMTRGKTRFFEGVWQSMYENTKTPKISPSIKTKYRRITLVSKDGSERLTIDFDVRANDLRDNKSTEVNLKNLIIVESKSLNKDCLSVRIMKKHNIKKAKSCSKYSLGVVYSGLAKKYDTFTATMKQIKEIRLDTIKNRKRTATGLKKNKTIKSKIKKLQKNKK
ncbi:MAG: polyphosphate polymerase domain-containing protein [Candidatus Gracilibacteria bacterium]